MCMCSGCGEGGLVSACRIMSDVYWEAFFSKDSGDFVIHANRSVMNGILKYGHSLLGVWGSRWWWRLVFFMTFSGYSLRRYTLS